MDGMELREEYAWCNGTNTEIVSDATRAFGTERAVAGMAMM